ncbi:hypothetical protein K3495_g11086 [Podosphaera aphanis]|nr:hypothetical protein K3495_g11086 [Podosphaera aphanis]
MHPFGIQAITQSQLSAGSTREEVPLGRDNEISEELVEGINEERDEDISIGVENVPDAEETWNIPDTPGLSETPPNHNLRRSTRLRKPIEPRSAWQPRPHALNTEKGSSIPKNFQDAVNRPNRNKWQAAIDEELDSLKVKRVFTPIIHVPHERKTVGSRWVFTVKSDGRYKSRLVAQGFSQVYGINYFHTYSPTLRIDSLRILLAVSAFYD